MQSKDQNINQSVIALSDELWEIQNNLKKASILLQEITEEYFSKYDRDKKDDECAILWEFPRYETYADMIYDYVILAKEKIDELKAIEEKIYDENEKLRLIDNDKETKTA